jgi:hypothetical protein
MAKLGAQIRRLGVLAKGYGLLAARHRRKAAMVPSAREESERLAAHFDRLAASKRHHLQVLLQTTGPAGATAMKPEARACVRCGRHIGRGLVLVDRLADGTVVWRCRNEHTCRRARAASTNGGLI